MALDAVVVIVIVIITALAVVVVAVRFIDFPTVKTYANDSSMRLCVCVCLFVYLCVRLKIFSIKL